jgi:hypothetical protein
MSYPVIFATLGAVMYEHLFVIATTQSTLPSTIRRLDCFASLAMTGATKENAIPASRFAGRNGV